MTVDELYDNLKLLLESGDFDGSEEVVVLNDDLDGEIVFGAWMGGVVNLTDYEEGEQKGLVIGYSNRPFWGYTDPDQWEPGMPVPDGFRVYNGDGESGPCYPTLVPIEED